MNFQHKWFGFLGQCGLRCHGDAAVNFFSISLCIFISPSSVIGFAF